MTKENAPPRGNSAARGNSSAVGTADAVITDATSRAQEISGPSLPSDGVHLASFWRGPRDRSRAIQFALKEHHGHQFLDVRQYAASSGYMLPTTRGVTLDVRQLGKFAAAAGRAYKEAVKLGLIPRSSS